MLNAKLGLKKVATPFVKEVRIKPVENGEFEISYAKILRKTIESVSYVRLDDTKLILLYLRVIKMKEKRIGVISNLDG